MILLKVKATAFHYMFMLQNTNGLSAALLQEVVLLIIYAFVSRSQINKLLTDVC